MDSKSLMVRVVALKNSILLHDAPYPMRRQALGLLSLAEAIVSA